MATLDQDDKDWITAAIAGLATAEAIEDLNTLLTDIQKLIAGLVMTESTIEALASQTSFTLVELNAVFDDDCFNGCPVVIESAILGIKCQGIVLDTIGSTRGITLVSDPGIFTIAVNDKVVVLAKGATDPQSGVTVAGFLPTAFVALLEDAGVITSIDGNEVEVTGLSNFTVGDILRVQGENELMVVASIDDGADAITLTRGAYGTTPIELEADHTFDIVSLTGTASVGDTGEGDVAVNHNYGSTDAYRVLDPDSDPIDNVKIEVFLSTDTDFSDVLARTYTGTDGKWVSPLMLDAGSYKIVFSKPGAMQETVASLTVT